MPNVSLQALLEETAPHLLWVTTPHKPESKICFDNFWALSRGGVKVNLSCSISVGFILQQTFLPQTCHIPHWQVPRTTLRTFGKWHYRNNCSLPTHRTMQHAYDLQNASLSLSSCDLTLPLLIQCALKCSPSHFCLSKYASTVAHNLRYHQEILLAPPNSPSLSLCSHANHYLLCISSMCEHALSSLLGCELAEWVP